MFIGRKKNNKYLRRRIGSNITRLVKKENWPLTMNFEIVTEEEARHRKKSITEEECTRRNYWNRTVKSNYFDMMRSSIQA